MIAILLGVLPDVLVALLPGEWGARKRAERAKDREAARDTEE